MADKSEQPLKEYIASMFSNWGFSWEGWLNNRHGEWFLIAQLTVITTHLLPAWPSLLKEGSSLLSILKVIGGFFFFIGIYYAIKAFIKLGPSLSPLPEPKTNASLITSGPYRNCRHPLYQALILSSAGIMVYQASFLHLILFLLLCYVLKSKALREEKRLKEFYPDYLDYMTKTPAIIKGFSYFDWRF